MIREELKKIWRPKTILALIVLGLVFYTMFLDSFIKYFPENYGGYCGRGVITVSNRLVKKYGTSLSKKEMEEAEAELPELIREAEGYLQAHEIGKKYSLKTYEDYRNFEQRAHDEASSQKAADQNECYADYMRLSNYMQNDATDNIDGRRYALTIFKDAYHNRLSYGPDEPTYDDNTYTPKEYSHAKQAFFGKDRMWQNILPEEVPLSIGGLIGNLLVWICLSVCLMLSPLPVHDRISRMRALQYSSRRGRGIFRSQFLAVMLSAFLLTTLNLLVIGGMFAKHGTSVFFPCRMFSFMLTPFCWPNWTHGTWCLVLAGICYLVSFGVTGAVFFLAQGSSNYIGLLLKLVPLFAAAAVICPKILQNAFYYTNTLYELSKIPYIEGICAVGILAIGMLLALAAWSKVKNEGK